MKISEDLTRGAELEGDKWRGEAGWKERKAKLI